MNREIHDIGENYLRSIRQQGYLSNLVETSQTSSRTLNKIIIVGCLIFYPFYVVLPDLFTHN